jgi:hypothetical protein
MSLDPRLLAQMGAGGQPVMMQSPTAQREAMQIQMTFANIQIAQNLVMSQFLFEDEKSGDADAKELRTAAKTMLKNYLAGLQTGMIEN